MKSIVLKAMWVNFFVYFLVVILAAYHMRKIEKKADELAMR